MNDAVDQLRSAVERTMAARTARFANLVIEQQGYGPIDIGMPDEEMANLPSGTRVGVRRLQGSPSLSVLGLLWVLSLVSRPTWWRYQRRMRRWRELNAGSVDFASRAILRKSGAVFGLRVDDRRFVGETGKWFELGPQPHHFTSPFWALELLRWVTHADEVAPETLHGVRCRHFSGRCDFRLAASRLGMAAPGRL